MLKIKLISFCTAAVLTIAFLVPNTVTAQKNQTRDIETERAQAAHSKVNLPLCDKVVPQRKKYLQKVADQKCATQTSCVKCMVGNEVIFANLVVAPARKNCGGQITVVEDTAVPSVKNIKQNSSSKPSPAPPKSSPDVPDFGNFEILQVLCKKGGSTLEIYIPGADFENPDFMKKSYTYLWEVDGRKAGHEASVQCACGSEATVRVTEVSTGRRVSKSITLKGCAGGSTKNSVKRKASQH